MTNGDDEGPRREKQGGDSKLGFTLVEAILVMALLALLVPTAWKLFSTFRSAGMRVAMTAEGLETVRTVAWILGEEFSGTIPGWDRWSDGGDSVSLRAYRGFAIVEGKMPGGGLRVCYRGLRSPDPAKDSVLFLTDGGGWRPHALGSRVRGEAGCSAGGDGWTEIWIVDPESSSPVVGRLFERGSYHLAEGALRYRRGAGGRQPLTPERVGLARLESAGGALSWELVLSTPWERTDTLPWKGWVR